MYLRRLGGVYARRPNLNTNLLLRYLHLRRQSIVKLRRSVLLTRRQLQLLRLPLLYKKSRRVLAFNDAGKLTSAGAALARTEQPLQLCHPLTQHH